MNDFMAFERLLSAALSQLVGAADALTAAAYPTVSLPRPRSFFVAQGLAWTLATPHQLAHAKEAVFLSANPAFHSGGRAILRACGYQPRKLLCALRRIQAATAWCEARTEGRRRAAREILRQQARAVEALEAEAALQALAKGGES